MVLRRSVDPAATPAAGAGDEAPERGPFPFAYIDPAFFPQIFAQDLSPKKAAELNAGKARQRHVLEKRRCNRIDPAGA